MRRLPVFILIDSSTSMKGEAMDAVNSGLAALFKDLRSNPFALETVFLSVISFNTEATIVRPFHDLLQNDSVFIEAKGQSNFGKGLDLLTEEITKHVNKSTKETKGDWKPLVFFMTDGRPSGAWKKRLKEFLALKVGKWVICACGMKSNMSIIESMGGNIVVLNNKNENSIHQFFKWVSNSISTHSKSIDQNQSEINDLEKFKILLDK
jgi:uncharacterized protein YegL